MLLRISKLNCCTTERLLPQRFSLFSKSRCNTKISPAWDCGWLLHTGCARLW